ncbi:hypothetical protein H0H93_007600 [Arthromyces matolae]|nr:hypothetical protein H0H93_007600 [Arthromyces matolae]
MSTTSINYAKYLGIESVAGASVFAVAYLPLFVAFVMQSIARPTYVYIVLSLFCAIRMAAFTIRAILAGSETAGETLGLYIADSVLFGVGFFALLYSAYTLVMDRWLLLDNPPELEQGPLRLLKNRRLFRIVLLVAVVIGVIGSTRADSSDPQNGKPYKVASTIIFLALTVLSAFQTVLLALSESRAGYRSLGKRTLGGEHGAYILCVIAALLLVREVFATVTVNDVKVQNNEHFWYPLFAIPEILAAACYATPGLVPPRSELPT